MNIKGDKNCPNNMSCCNGVIVEQKQTREYKERE